MLCLGDTDVSVCSSRFHRTCCNVVLFGLFPELLRLMEYGNKLISSFVFV